MVTGLCANYLRVFCDIRLSFKEAIIIGKLLYRIYFRMIRILKFKYSFKLYKILICFIS